MPSTARCTRLGDSGVCCPPCGIAWPSDRGAGDRVAPGAGAVGDDQLADRGVDEALSLGWRRRSRRGRTRRRDDGVARAFERMRIGFMDIDRNARTLTRIDATLLRDGDRLDR